MKKIVELRPIEAETQKHRANKKYFLVVSDEGCVMECYAESYKDLLTIVRIYDDDEIPHDVSLVIDVEAREMYEIERRYE